MSVMNVSCTGPRRQKIMVNVAEELTSGHPWLINTDPSIVNVCLDKEATGVVILDRAYPQ